MEMSIAAMSVGMAQQRAAQGLDISVLKMAMDNMESTGDMLAGMAAADTKMLALAAQPFLGGNIDIAV